MSATKDTRGAMESSSGDDELALEAKNSIEARNALYMACREQIGRLARPVTRMVERDGVLQPEDIEQQAFVEFCKLLDEWTPGQTPFRAYLSRMLRWQLMHYVRRHTHYRSKVRAVPLLPDTQQGEEAHADVEDGQAQSGLISIENSEVWKRRTQGLEEGLRWAVELRYGRDLPSSEIAGIQGCSRRTIDRNLRAALKTIRQNIIEEWEGCDFGF